MRRSSSRSQWRTIAALGTALALASSACGGAGETALEDGTTAGGDASADSGGTDGSPSAGGSVAMGITVPIQTTDPYPSRDDAFAMKELLFDTLVSLDEDIEPAAELAESWDVAEDQLSLTFKLREGVVFHSGAPFDAEAAKWSIDYAKDPAHKAQAASQLASVETVVVDPLTIRLDFEVPTPQIFSLLNQTVIMDPASEASIANGAVGTGPYGFASLTPGDQLRLVRNDEYWNGPADFDEVILRTIPDETSLVSALEAGDIDIAYQVPYSEVERLSSGQTTTLVTPGAGAFNIMVNAGDGPTADVQVRQALDLALDRERFTDTLLYGVTDPLCQIFPESSPAYEPSIECRFDLDEARSLLEEAGYAEGFELLFQVNRDTVSELADFAQIYQADLAQIGVTLRIEEMEANAWLQTIVEAKFPGVLGHRYSFANQDPALLFTALPFKPEENSPRYDSPQWSSMIAQAQIEENREARLELYRGIAQFAQQEAFNLPMANQPRAIAMRADISGVTLSNGDLSVQLVDAHRGE